MTRSSFFIFPAIVLLAGITLLQNAWGQNGASATTAKSATRVLTLTGSVADDRTTFLAEKDGTRWVVENPDALKGYEGRQVMLKARTQQGSTAIQVFKVRTKPEVTSAARLGDAAFRR